MDLPAGQTLIPVPVPIVDDDLVELAETFALEIQAAPGASYVLGQKTRLEVTINDNERLIVAFGDTATAGAHHEVTVSEAAGSVTIPVIINRSPPENTRFVVRVPSSFNPDPGQASSRDYQQPPGDLIAIDFAQGGTLTSSFAITLIDDDEVEDDETLSLLFARAFATGSGKRYEGQDAGRVTITITSED